MSLRSEDIKGAHSEKTDEELLAVWTENRRDEWSDDTFDVFREMLEERGIDVPEQKKHKDPKEYFPWQRFWARTMDFTFFAVVTGVIIFILDLWVPFNTAFIELIENPVSAMIIFSAIWIPVEAVFLSRLGTTPMKWLFGISVKKSTGAKLSCFDALRRAWLVFFRGEAFGLPLFIAIARYRAYHRLLNTGSTLWDTASDAVVTREKTGVLRTILLIFSFILWFAIVAVESL